MASIKPLHVGPRVLPNFPLFSKLLGYAARSDSIVIRDVTNDYTATHAQLLTDVLNVRNVLLDVLDEETKEQLRRGEEVYINNLTPAGYEFAVGFLAILAVGAIIVPLSPALPVKEATYFVQTSRAVATLTASRCAKLGRDLAAEVSRTFQPKYKCLELGPIVKRPPLAAGEIFISRDHFLDYDGSGLVIFTSGTTGPPKGAMRRRSFFDAYAQVFANMFYLGPSDVVMHNLPVHHVTGIGTSFLPYLSSGACIEFHSGGFDVAKVWDGWRKKDLTLFSGVPTIYMRLMQYYELHISKLPEKERQEYLEGVNNLRALMCGTAALPRPLQRKWFNLVPKRILERYGSTECSSTFTIHPKDDKCPEGSVGKPVAGLDVKLSEGDTGEILIKSPYMFSKYIFDEAATNAAFDAEGYFKSGDIGRREGDYFFILGRASVDILKSGGYKISALDVEREVLGLDYIAEVAVVGVDDEEFGDRVAAAIVLKPGVDSLTLDKLRQDLRDTLAGYKMPTMLRVVPELPKTASGKVPKKVLKPSLFPPQGHRDVQVWHSKRNHARL